MNIVDFMIDLRQLWAGESPPDGPLALVDLGRADPHLEPIFLPPCPVIGLGDSGHPISAVLDAVIEPPVTVEQLVYAIEAKPQSAAAIVQLLRILPEMSPEAGLTAESMAYAMLQGSSEHRDWLASRRDDVAPSEEGRVVLERDDEHLIVTLDRPNAGNAIDRAMRDGLYDAFSLAALDPSIEKVFLRADGKAFSLGAELAEFGTTTDPATAHSLRGRTLPARMALRCAVKLEAHVAGACVGAGLEIAAWASRITATPNAWFQLPELSMGVLPGAGGCVSLTRRIGRQRTALMILSGRRLNARQALDWGLIDAIEDDPA